MTLQSSLWENRKREKSEKLFYNDPDIGNNVSSYSKSKPTWVSTGYLQPEMILFFSFSEENLFRRRGTERWNSFDTHPRRCGIFNPRVDYFWERKRAARVRHMENWCATKRESIWLETNLLFFKRNVGRFNRKLHCRWRPFTVHQSR